MFRGTVSGHEVKSRVPCLAVDAGALPGNLSPSYGPSLATPTGNMAPTTDAPFLFPPQLLPWPQVIPVRGFHRRRGSPTESSHSGADSAHPGGAGCTEWSPAEKVGERGPPWAPSLRVTCTLSVLFTEDRTTVCH